MFCASSLAVLRAVWAVDRRSLFSDFFQQGCGFGELRVEILPQQVEDLFEDGVAERIEDLIALLAADDDLAGAEDGEVLRGVGLVMKIRTAIAALAEDESGRQNQEIRRLAACVDWSREDEFLGYGWSLRFPEPNQVRQRNRLAGFFVFWRHAYPIFRRGMGPRRLLPARRRAVRNR